MGVICNSENNYNDHVGLGHPNKTKLITTAKRKLGLLRHIKYWTNPNQLRLIANSIFNGPILYGVQSWSTCKPTLVESVEVIREKAARLIAGVHQVRMKSRDQVYKLIRWRTIFQIAHFHNMRNIHRTLQLKKPLHIYQKYTIGRDKAQIDNCEIISFTRSQYNAIPLEKKTNMITPLKI